jgi:pyruvate/2-oxoglutarate dehydrogenase complex dihydrolipoamide dehydrogenase (E3) component
VVERVDVIVLGMGPGGEEVVGRLAQAGLAVVGVEKDLVGGECPYWACVPTKMMVRAAGLLAEARRIPGMAGDASVRPDWAPVAARIRDEATDNWDDRVAVDRFTGKGGRFVRGSGRLAGPGRVAVGDDEFEAGRAVVVATGTQPAIPPIDGLADTPYWTNRQAVSAPSLPASLVVLGGGAVGLELAQTYARFGVDVTVVEAADRLVAAEEPEASTVAADALRRDGVSVRVGASARRVRNNGSAFEVTLDDGSAVGGERLLVATGRRCDLAQIGVDTVGLDPSAKFVETDDRLRAGERLWAVGDVTGRGAFTHVAMYQADIVVRDILGQGGPSADYRALPRVTFTDPEIGSVGRTESAARDAGLRVRVGVASVPSSARGWIHKAGNDGFIKLVVDDDRGVLVGATSVGPAGGEVLGGLAVAVHAEVPVDGLRQMIYAYPTFYRAVQDALRAL